MKTSDKNRFSATGIPSTHILSMTDSPFVKILITHRNNELLTIERYGIAGSFRRDGSAGHDPFPGIELNVVIHEDFETSLSRFDYDYLVVPSPPLKSNWSDTLKLTYGLFLLKGKDHEVFQRD